MKTSGYKKSFIEAIIIAAVFFVFGLLLNLVHPNSIDYFAKQPYETVVPCPVSGGEAEAIEAGKINFSENLFFVDARYEEDFEQWHIKGAHLLTFDYLAPVPPEDLASMAKEITSSRASRVIVYGDGEEPDTGDLLGRDISGFGINNVYYVQGGAKALMELYPEGELK